LPVSLQTLTRKSEPAGKKQAPIGCDWSLALYAFQIDHLKIPGIKIIVQSIVRVYNDTSQQSYPFTWNSSLQVFRYWRIFLSMIR
jgi:hypothetical protein